MDKLTLGTRNVSIEFPGVKALTDVNFEVSTGEIRALVGANGAGKSTLMKVFAGANPDYTGEVYLNDKVVELRTPMAAKKLGIQIVYQEVDMALAMRTICFCARERSCTSVRTLTSIWSFSSTRLASVRS